jgi:hypothetical protein
MIRETSVILSRMYLKGCLDPMVSVREYELMLYLAHRIATQKGVKSYFLNSLDFFFDDVKDFKIYNTNLDITATIFGKENKHVERIEREDFDKAVAYIEKHDPNFLVVVDHIVKLMFGFETTLGLEILALSDYISNSKNSKKLLQKVVVENKRFSERQFNVGKARLKDYDKVRVAS